MKMKNCREALVIAVLAVAFEIPLAANAGTQEHERCPEFGVSHINDSRLAVFVREPAKDVLAVELCLAERCATGLRVGNYFVSEFGANLNDYYTIKAVSHHKSGRTEPREETLQFDQSVCLDKLLPSAPHSIAGLDVVLSITDVESTLPGGFPTMGAVVQSYDEDGTYIYEGFGGANHLTGDGTYNYIRTGLLTAVESAIQSAPSFTLPYTMEYTFATDTGGYWKQYFAGGLIIFAGTFVTSESEASSCREYAPESIGGLAIQTRSEGVPRRPALRRYDEYGRYSVLAAGGVEMTGQYTYKKLSSKSAVEEYVPDTQAPSDGFVRVYTFYSATSGEWYEKSRDGKSEKFGSFRMRR